MRVFISSPYRGKDQKEKRRNRRYLLKCIKDSLARSEAPFAPHDVFPRHLDDDIEEERAWGMYCALDWLRAAEKVAFYHDHGLTDGMLEELKEATDHNIPFEFRTLKR